MSQSSDIENLHLNQKRLMTITNGACRVISVAEAAII
jgi:hypothetical protein